MDLIGVLKNPTDKQHCFASYGLDLLIVLLLQQELGMLIKK